MVKRSKSPDTEEDEKYFTVYQPYPLNANWEIDDDYITFSRWIACCIGNAPLHALYYKPKARGMVLLEIDKKYPHNDRLLGEHRWSEFLINPSEEEKDRVTQIFHSLYTTGREAQKDGWKRIHVEGSWFKDWSSDNFVVKNPYPGTHWCPTPPEDKTNKPLCRPLPVAVKPPPHVCAEKPAVPGSAAWKSAKDAPRQNTPPTLRGAWAAKQKTTPAAVQSTPPAQPNTNVPISTGRARQSPRTKPGTEKTPVPSTPWAKPITAQVPAYPPGLGPRTSSAAIPPVLVHSGGSGSSSSSGSGPSSESKSKFSWGDEPLETLADRLEQTVTISLSPSQDRALYGTPLDDVEGDGADMSPDLYTTPLAPWEQSFKTDYKIDTAVDTEDNIGNLWAEEEKIPRKPVAPEVPECPVHKKICKKGICKEMSKIVRQMEKEKKEKEKAKEKGGNAKGRGRNRGRGNWRNNEGGGEGSSNEDANNHVDGDGFPTVPGSGRSRASGDGPGKTWGKGCGQGVDVGRNKAGSVSSNSGSAGQPASGWTGAASWN